MDTPAFEARYDLLQIAARTENIKKELAALSGGRDVKLLAVTKTVPVEVINYAIDELGITAIGENRVQELLSKYDSLHSPAGGKLEIHLIGSLQTNKVKYIIDKVDMIESVDSVKLAAEIDKQAKKHSLVMDILVEVNIGREPQKGGIMPEELVGFIEEISVFPNIRIRGLMTIAPKCEDKNEYLSYFSETKQLFDAILQKTLDNSLKKPHNIYGASFDVLSMGMSGSYREAIVSGSTEIRLGSTLFGARIYPEENNK